ncbi:helix-turn-helix domain-containing protein [Geitlerinema sp. PCC 9228]|uniref:helix-turn-helix domain-containing protein n=1 Tax=Geitlerinema sp. PCC 9228 TaxID=111611 RepID=UPI0008F9CDA2
MLVLTYSYRIYPDLELELQMLNWLETCRQVYNHAVEERKDWIDSRKCPVNACSLQKEYIIPADPPYPDSYRQKKGLTESKKQKHSGWYVMLTLKADVDVPNLNLPPAGHLLGWEVGLEYFLSTSDGEQVSRPRFFNRLHRKLKGKQ